LPGGGRAAATTLDSSFSIAVPCLLTADTAIGSDCSTATTANTLVPGSVTETQRAIWQLGQIQVYDGGADGLASTEGDNTLFMDQGVFIP
jgi:hypothetical protein